MTNLEQQEKEQILEFLKVLQKKYQTKDIEIKDRKAIIKMPTYNKVISLNFLPSKTEEHWGPDTDVNNIIEHFAKTGQITSQARSQGVYADVSQVTDLLESHMTLKDAISQFESLPKEFKDKYDSDPYKFAREFDLKNHTQEPQLKSDKQDIKKDIEKGTKDDNSRSESAGDQKG